MNLSLREKMLVSILVCVLAIYLFYNYAYIPVQQEASEWMGKNVMLREQVIAARRTDKSVKNMKVKQQLYQDRYTELARQIPSAEYIPEVVAFVENTAEESGLALMVFNYQKEEQPEKSNPKNNNQNVHPAGVKSIDFYLAGRGSYYDAITFVELLEKAARIYTVREAALLANEYKTETLAVLNEGQSSTSWTSELNGVSRFDPNDITLTIRFRTYYDEKGVRGITDVDNAVEPVASQRDNPFTP
jgi:Tfp pilus assembly protein PilO